MLLFKYYPQISKTSCIITYRLSEGMFSLKNEQDLTSRTDFLSFKHHLVHEFHFAIWLLSEIDFVTPELHTSIQYKTMKLISTIQ